MEVDAFTITCGRKRSHGAFMLPTFLAGLGIVTHKNAWMFIPDELGPNAGLIANVVLGGIVLQFGGTLVDEGY